MSSSFQSSFIPKSGDASGEFPSEGGGIFKKISILILILSIFSYLGLLGYQFWIDREISGLRLDLEVKRQSVDNKSIAEIFDFDKRIKASKNILLKHQAATLLYDMLSSSTVSSIQLNDFSYSILDADKGSLSVRLKGKSPDYQTLALQDKIFRQAGNIKSVDMREISLQEAGYVSFGVNLLITPDTTLYSSLPALKINTKPAGITIPTSTPITNEKVSTSTSTKKSATSTAVSPGDTGVEVGDIKMPDFNNL